MITDSQPCLDDEGEGRGKGVRVGNSAREMIVTVGWALGGMQSGIEW